ncbi:alkaline phosphatase [Candidatus Symbiothrix dinenymphae]|nr:alkaline phosphatase [Candidatus Symbiothrix dinenymphae]
MKKIRKQSLLFALLLISCSLFAQVPQVKNVILMIPDGTSLSAVSAARWLQRYNQPELTHLNIDPYLAGTVLTYSSDAPIGDSAPTTSCYMTGYPSRAGYVSTYPVAMPEADIIPMDASKAYQPLMTLLEAARIVQQKSTGLVVTCEFTHATPADCSAHSYKRGNYDWIAPQVVHNDIDVVIGGGVSILKPELQAYLKKENYGLFLNDLEGYNNYKGNKMWALFNDKDLPYELDRDHSKYPSMAEMTAKAIEKLAKNDNGFFLMVEGSKVDWAAHNNDPIGIMTEMLAFDRACGVALDWAKRDGNTLVVIVPDHGNSGFSIGASHCRGYSSMSKSDLFGPVARFKVTYEGLTTRVKATEPNKIKDVVQELTGFELADTELSTIKEARDDDKKLFGELRKIFNSKLCFGFTTFGHTGEEVFLGIYDPRGSNIAMRGHHTNVELNHYMREAMGLYDLETLTAEHFAKHTEVFAGLNCTITGNEKTKLLTVKNKKNKVEIQQGSNLIKHNGKEIKLSSVIVYVDVNNTFYLPQSLKNLLK